MAADTLKVRCTPGTAIPPTAQNVGAVPGVAYPWPELPLFLLKDRERVAYERFEALLNDDEPFSYDEDSQRVQRRIDADRRLDDPRRNQAADINYWGI